MITILVDEEEFLELLMERVSRWEDDADVIELYRQMYSNAIDGGCFEGAEFNVAMIVDNDCINNCRVIAIGDDEYSEIKRIFDEQGCGDCSCETEICDFIEAEYNNYFLVR